MAMLSKAQKVQVFYPGSTGLCGFNRQFFGQSNGFTALTGNGLQRHRYATTNKQKAQTSYTI